MELKRDVETSQCWVSIEKMNNTVKKILKKKQGLTKKGPFCTRKKPAVD